MEQGEFPEAGIDFDRANAARMYDYMLGGAHNFAIDRDQVAQAVAGYPGLVALARANRAYLDRVVRWCVEQGIEQFLDLGSGVPTVGNVHEIAHRLNPAVRVAYVDFEPVAVAHAQEIVAALDTVTATRADLRVPRSVLDAPGVAGLLDFTRPVALLAVAVLHFVPGDIAAILGRYRAALVSGSVVAISHGSVDQDDPELGAHIRGAADGYQSSATPVTLRSREQLRALLDGLDLVPPGLVDVTRWPKPHPEIPPVGFYAAVGLVPGPAPPSPISGP